MRTCQSRKQPSFISIDCGIAADDTYVDNDTKITYISDQQFIDRGVSRHISADYIPSLPRQEQTLLSFPTGDRNCYTIKQIEQNHKYLVRGSFTYGNYDGKASQSMSFDLYLGVNHWQTMNITDPSVTYRAEALINVTTNFVSVCLINTQNGTPFISSLELRPLKDELYAFNRSSQTQYMNLVRRGNFGSLTNQTVRYPNDPYDLLWPPMPDNPKWTTISSTTNVLRFDFNFFEVPSVVLQTAVLPTNSNTLEFSLYGISISKNIWAVLHFCELQQLPANKNRVFNIDVNNIGWYTWGFKPEPRYASYAYGTEPLISNTEYTFSLKATADSEFPPFINAFEVYEQMQFTALTTQIGDVDAITAIKIEYQVLKNWMGDPCYPQQYSWEQITCVSSRITAVNLSSSELTGVVSSSFANLTALQTIDLSNNKLTGAIPDFLANIASLKVINLENNNFCGGIPQSLLSKSEKGLLQLSYDSSMNPCDAAAPSVRPGKKSSTVIIVVASVISGFLLFAIITFAVWRIRKRRDGPDKVAIEAEHQNIGKGGFGTVYHGYLENGKQVAAKMLSQSSSQGTREFLAEARNLSRIHHRNLVSLVGYCMDGEYLALVYEYMPNGSLVDHLRGINGGLRNLNWGNRIRIATEAAQGLEYLHRGCNPSIIHRDVKTSNILLGEELEAKIADFGLSKAYNLQYQSHITVETLVGTPGYLDPEFSRTLQLSDKSDVYSFGIVLLELITGEPPILLGPVNSHIVDRVIPKVRRGDTNDIIDKRLGDYDANSIWMVLDLAMRCTAENSSQRPTMSDVVLELKNSLELEFSNGKQHSQSLDMSLSSAFELGEATSSFSPHAR